MRPINLAITLASMLLAACTSVRELQNPGFYSRQVTIESRGVQVPATYVVPLAAGAHPVLVMAHGHGGTRDEAGGFVRVAEALGRLGVASIRMDFPGCGESTESFAENNLDNMLRDIKSARAYALAQSGADSKRVGLLGYSIGGRLAMMATGQDAYTALALWAPVGDRDTMVQFLGGPEAWQRHKASARTQDSTVFTTPWGDQQQLGIEFFTDLERSAPLDSIKMFSGPVLVVYGDQDQVVAPQVSLSVADAARASAQVVRREITGADHGLGFYSGEAAHAAQVISTTVRFLSKSLAQ
ncbi:MAG: alpha/beta fold hydrolase [Gammaproteobacteria bacterium]|nr:alpha/beta fold hydrolase [Gammaproteobacteria bacterium]MDH3766911.1 alpha/beta fold hydrolase [Gammaproteobacteria bacterium]